MHPHEPLLTPESIQMLVSSITQNGTVPLSEISAERFLNAVTRAQSNVPTGVSVDTEPSKEDRNTH